MIHLEDVLKMSWRRFEDVLKTSWRRLEDVLKTSWKRLEDVLKTYSQDEYIGLDQDVLKTSSEDVRLRRTYSSWSRRLQDIFRRQRWKTSSSRRMFAGMFPVPNISPEIIWRFQGVLKEKIGLKWVNLDLHRDIGIS